MVRVEYNSPDYHNRLDNGWLLWYYDRRTNEAVMMYTRGYLDWRTETRNNQNNQSVQTANQQG